MASSSGKIESRSRGRMRRATAKLRHGSTPADSEQGAEKINLEDDFGVTV